MKEKRIAWTLAIHTFIFSSICKHVKSVIEPDDRQESALIRIMPIFTIIFIFILVVDLIRNCQKNIVLSLKEGKEII